MADAKTREREDQLCLKEAEFERKLKAIEERILYKRGKNEEREILDNKREHAIQLEEIMRKYGGERLFKNKGGKVRRNK